METRERELSVVRASRLPFEQLPNLPKPLIPQIDLGIARTDVLSAQLSLASQRRVGFFLSDGCTQTEQSDILDVKQIASIIQGLIQDVGQLRRDVNFAQHVLKANYEGKLNERATELYALVNARMAALEKHHQEKVEIVRKSYRTQLSNAIQKIAGEYKAYYDELLSGKTGRHDLKIKELKEKVTEQERALEEQALAMEKLSLRLQQYEDEEGRESTPPPPPPPPGISLEEAEELQGAIDRLEGERVEMRAELAAKEDANRKLTRQMDTLCKQLEDERGKVARLKRDMESFKKKAKQEQEKAARMAESQMAAMEKEMKEKMERAEQDAAQKAEEQAELQRMRDRAKHQEEMDQRRSIEEQLRAQQLQQQEKRPASDGDELERLQRVEQRQREEIERLNKELDRTNRVWEMKLAIMQRNFHSLRDECFIRHSLQRQAATLSHATVGYAVSGTNAHQRIQPKNLKPLPNIAEKFTLPSSSDSREKTATFNSDTPLSLPPPPSPIYRSPSRNVHFDHSNAEHPPDPLSHSSRASLIHSQS